MTRWQRGTGKAFHFGELALSRPAVSFLIRFLGLLKIDQLLKRLHHLIINPFRRRLDLGGRFVSSIFSPASGQPADGANGHVVVTHDLTTKPDARQPTCRQHIAFGNCHPIGLAGDNLDPAGRAACISTAGMQLIDSGVLLESKH
jgi:hypothetical protein